MTTNAPLSSRIVFCAGILFGFLASPPLAHAAVFISEVAWMGSLESANHEWIELTNDGDSVAVDGWSLTDSQNLTIALEGTIPANTTVVLERTSDQSAPPAAFLIYTGALVNSGATLRLTDASGQLVDMVSGGDNWELIGGDNVTKETAQYTTKGWVTAVATPGQYDDSPQPMPAEDEEESAGTPSSAAQTSTTAARTQKESVQTVPLVLPDVTLQLAVEAQSTGYVNQAIAFAVTPSGIGQHLTDSLVYQWNFGDGFTSAQSAPSHIFAYPGTYVVTVKASYKRQHQLARHRITILPVDVSITKNRAGDIQLNNDSPYELDISGYTVAGAKDFTFPEYSVLLPQQTITIPKSHITTSYEPMYAVYDTQGVLLTGSMPESLSSRYAVTQSLPAPKAQLSQTSQVSTAVVPSGPAPVVAAAPPRTPSESVSVEQSETASQPLVLASQAQATPASAVPFSRNQRLVYVLLASVVLLAIFSLYLRPSEANSRIS